MSKNRPSLRRRSLAASLLAIPVISVLTFAAAPAHAAYPERAVRLIVPFPAGGAADMMARSLAQKLSEQLGQQVVVDNRGGAGGTTAAEAATAANPDGYTLFFGTMGTQAINPALYPKLRYDPVKDFEYVSLTHTTPRVLVVHPSVDAKTVQELIVLAKKNPGKLTYGSAGNGSSSHLSGALFASMAGVEMLHIPYKGSAPLLNDLIAGRLSMTFDSYAVYGEHIKSGKVRPLGVTSITRITSAPDIPTISESGLKGYDVSNWLGLLAPKGTSPDVVARLNTAVVKAASDKAMRDHLAASGIETTSSTPEAFKALVVKEIPKWAEVVKKSGATVD
ncbi:Bug family tripartite tricarboxylate transporter substrate binding protein [Pigmentiphaga litoralis]|uniref:Tripartite-type tricarboxylate transporter receptor subunit TctC n=1 Tax=Pigmentiphaga litoralis TaxID=516702 RepID=A0A7Y9IQ73_9BURK|nr:tripartite tricarboxylate transporter substrate binding protein [Pigmentiphaga litoralis]NYE25337.1 tripartite-type tricarboxylate transporter receptor subunit TctC [Pigmentiphaga litoralis]NYE81050.1 tripartite-type tricarboxylate transporter receptor subunit TctC [Pigmentiphaga litoralis]